MAETSERKVHISDTTVYQISQNSENITEAFCLARGCLWSQDSNHSCFYPHDYRNYDITYITSDNSSHWELILQKTSRASGFRDDIQNVRVTVIGVSDDVVDVRIEQFVLTGEKNSRWKPPIPVLNLTGSRVSHPKWTVSVTESNIVIYRKTNHTVIMSFNVQQLIFSDQFIQAIVSVPTDSLYGLGERMSRHRKTPTYHNNLMEGRFVFWNHRTPEKDPSHGSHPFYLMYEPGSSDAHGVLFFNSNACDATLTSEPSIVWRTIGGDMRFLLFMGPNAVDVVRQKAAVIGHSPLPAYWTLGFHLSRSGYRSLNVTRSVLMRNVAAGIPIDVQYVDIEYTDQHNTLTVNNQSYKNMTGFAAELRSRNRRLVPVLDMEISSHAPEGCITRHAFRTGLHTGIFIRNQDKSLMLTTHRNPDVAIPDFTHANVSFWWTDQLRRFHTILPFDGLWLDVNEPDVKWRIKAARKCKIKDQYNRPQYNPVAPIPLTDRTICMTASHTTGIHYNVHNVHPLFQSMHTFYALKQIHKNKRPFILSRATTTGSGAYIAHWTGDINSSWKHMQTSVSAVLDFNLFGIPLIGADICGFKGSTQPELCARWHSLGVFYSFSRNHNDKESKPQDPVSMGPVVVKAARRALRLRYQLLPLLYTLFHENSVSGAPVVRSLKMNFPSDGRTDDIDQQFMWGHSLLISPVLRPAVKRLTAYFPAGVWYDVRTGRVVSHSVSGKTVTLNVPITEISVTLMGGQVIAVKENRDSNGKEVQTTADHRNIAFSLIVGLDGESRASGRLYWDDGDGDRTDGKYFLIDFDVRDRCLKTTVSHSFDYSGEKSVHQIRVFGLQAKSGVTVTASSQVLSKRQCDTEYNRNTGVAVVTLSHGLTIDRKFTVCWTSLL